ncbi:MAG: hypothetical protein CMN87_07625 [Stappia sp.]|jgi:hypothetical protein|uniref:hypothetical protein n=1 Tax=Stappia sp. TaxID=1870903 RepID=UPI000C65ED97|nr:hypothetical protein [Stappia sp.]MAB01134.1 hypothetical protein [Stappia sp.]MBM19862.1 hypothetical protein [Stappia sp.]
MNGQTDNRGDPASGDPATGVERLVVEGLRCWLAGYRDGRIETWETAWSLFARTLGVTRARAAVSALSCYARALNTWAKVGFEMMPSECPGRCAHECLAIALVSAWQRGRREEAAGIADELVVSGGLPETLEAAANLADTLRRLDMVLPHGPGCFARALAGLAPVPGNTTRH